MKPFRRAKSIGWIAIFLLLAVGAAWAVRPQAVKVTTGRVARGALTSTVHGEGRARVKDLYVVSAPVDGELDRIEIKPGDATTKGESLASIRSAVSRPLDSRTRAQANAAAAAAHAGVARAEAVEEEAHVALEHADSELETARKLTQSGAIPADELTHRGHESEMRGRAMQAAAAGSREMRAELVRAIATLGTGDDSGPVTFVRAPVTGSVLRVLRESAGPIAAGTPIFEVGDVGRLEVDADLLSSDVAQVQNGASATVTGWGGAEPIRAFVRRVDPAGFTKVSALGLEEQRVHVVLDLADTPPKGLGHEYRVNVAIVVWESKDVLRIPSTALFREGDKWAIFVVKELHARRRVVGLGPNDGAWTVATGGVSDGDEAITQPSDAIDDGTRVRLR